MRWKTSKLIIMGLVFLLCVVALAFFFVAQESEGYLKSLLIEKIEERLGAPVQLGRLQLSVFKGTVELIDLQLGDPTASEGPPMIRIDRTAVSFHLLPLILKRRLELDQIQLDSPVFRLHSTPDEGWNLARLWQKSDAGNKTDGGVGIEVHLESVAVRDGTLEVGGQSFAVESAEGGLDIEVRHPASGYVGDIALNNFQLRLGERMWGPLDLDIGFDLPSGGPLLVRRATLESEIITAMVSGQVKLGQPVTYDLDIDSELKQTDLFLDESVRGKLLVKGHLSGGGGADSFIGTASSQELRVFDLPFLDMQSDFEWRPGTVRLDRLEAGYASGHISLKGTVSLTSEESRVEVVASRLNPAALQKWVPDWIRMQGGSLSSRGEATWPGLSFARFQASLLADFRTAIHFWNQAAGQTIPFRGVGRLAVSTQGIALSDFETRSTESEAVFDGWLPFSSERSFDLNISLRSRDDSLHDYLIDFWPGPGTVEAARTEATMKLEGRPKATIRLSGEGSLQDVSFAGEEGGDFSTHFDFTSGTLEMKGMHLQGPAGEAGGEATLSFPGEGTIAVSSAEIELDDFSLPSILAAIEQPVPLEGTVSGHFRLTHTESGLSGEGSFTSGRVSFQGYSAEQVEVHARAEGTSIQVDRLRANIAGGTVDGELVWDEEDMRGRMSLSGAHLDQLAGGEESDWLSGGTASGELQLHGLHPLPDLELEAEIEGMELSGRPLSTILLQARTQLASQAVEFRVQSQPFGFATGGSGVMSLVEPYQIQANLETPAVPLPALLEALTGEQIPEIEGEVLGALKIHGPAMKPEDWTVQATLQFENTSIRGHSLRSETPLQISYEAESLVIRPFVIQGDKGNVSLQGKLALKGKQNVLIEADGNIDLVLLMPFFDNLTCSGNLDLKQLFVSGSISDPEVVGEAKLTQASVRHPDLPVDLSNIEGTLKFTRKQIALDRVSATTGYGQLQIDGGVFLEGLAPSRWSLNIYGQGLRFEYPKNMHSTVDVDFDFAKSAASELLSGNVYVRSASFNTDISVPELALRLAQVRPGPSRASDQNIEMDVRVQGYRTLSLENNLGNLIGSIDLRVIGTLNDPILLGNLNIDEGYLKWEGNRYELARGTVSFSNPRSTKPVFLFEAATQVRGYDITAVANGPVEQLNVSFRSDPPLPTADVVSLLALGTSPDERRAADDTQQGRGGAFTGAGSVLSRVISQELSTQTSRLFGLDRFTIDPFATDSARNPATRVTLSKEVGRNLSVTYSTDLGSTQLGQGVIIQLNLTEWLTAVGTRDPDGDVGVDFKLKTRF